MRKAALGLVLAALLGAAPTGLGPLPTADAAKQGKPGKFPWDERIADAARYARGRSGSVSFAVVDEGAGSTAGTAAPTTPRRAW